ncbi:hypothetical protein MIAR_17040 [Microbacterium arabinogalactanolyticum]|nr:hypothetical protein MIAR_17040 [Microbacterium arabinogalactanolyticum]
MGAERGEFAGDGEADALAAGDAGDECGLSGKGQRAVHRGSFGRGCRGTPDGGLTAGTEATHLHCMPPP